MLLRSLISVLRPSKELYGCMLCSSWFWKCGGGTFTKETLLYKREVHVLVFWPIKGKSRTPPLPAVSYLFATQNNPEAQVSYSGVAYPELFSLAHFFGFVIQPLTQGGFACCLFVSLVGRGGRRGSPSS